MNSGELLRLQLANRLLCSRQQGCIGATGPAGAALTIPGALKAFTIYLDYSAANAISRIYIPPGLFGPAADPQLQLGGVFTANVGTDLVFQYAPPLTPIAAIVMQNTKYAFAAGLSANGYINSQEWQIVPPSNIRPQAGYLNYKVATDYSITVDADLNPLNGANLSNYPSTGIAAGFLATVTIFYV